MKDTEIIRLVSDYFKKGGFDAERIPTCNAKTPDLLVKKNDNPSFYCEVKNPSLRLDEETGLYKHTTTTSKLNEFISRAHEQFKEYDPDHFLPWGIVFVSSYFQLNWNNLGNCIKGFVGNQPSIVVDLRNTATVKRVADDIRKLDFMIWLQIGYDNKIYQVTVFINERCKELEKVKYVANVLVPGDNVRHKQKFYYK